MAFTTYTVGTGVGADYATIQEALSHANDGDVINVQDGTYTLTSTLYVEKGVTIHGESESGVIIDATSVTGYGIFLSGDGATLSTFTLHGPTGGSGGGDYGIKVQPAGSAPTDAVTNITLEHLTVTGSARSEVDLNGVDHATLTDITADGQNTAGVGIAITDSTDITLTDISTTGNNWGSVALYTTGNYYEPGTGDITFLGTYSHTESIGIFSQDESGTADLGTVTFPPSFTNDGDGVFQVTNDSFRGAAGDSDTFTHFFGSESDASTFAQGLPDADRSVVHDPDGNLVVTDGMSIQAAIDAAEPGDTIIVRAGTYNESLTIGKEVHIQADDGAVLTGTLLDDLGVPDGMPLNDFMEQHHPAYSGSLGIQITADDVSISGLTITGFSEAVAVGTSDGVSITGNTFIDNITGLRKGTADQVTNVTISDNSFSQGVHGITIYAAPDGSGSFDQVTMDDNTFSALSEKGMYFEQLSNASLDGNSFDDVGNYGRISPPFGGTDGEFGQAIDINLKYETYSNVTFTDTTITNSGNSNQDGAGDSGDFGAAIGVKTRDDAPSYSSPSAHFTGDITFDGLTIDGTSTGVRVGEPGKDNGGPDVHLTNFHITNATVTDVDNATDADSGGTATIDFDATQTDFDGTPSQASLAVNGNDLDNTIVTGSGDDHLSGGGGNDNLNGGSGFDVAHFSGDRDGYLIEEVSHGVYRVTDTNLGDGDDGVDTLTNVEGVQFDGGGPTVYEIDSASPTYSGSFVRFHQDFKTDTSGILDDSDYSGYGTVDRVSDGDWHGVTSADGDGHYAVVTEGPVPDSDGGPFTRFDSYKADFNGGFEASVKVYLDPNLIATGEGFDVSVAANNQDGNHLRDFIIHVAHDISTGDLLIGADNNSNFEPREDLENGNHATISDAGWYTFDYRFYENADHTLEVAMNVYNQAGDWVFTEVRNDPNDVIASVVGGNRYLWFPNVDVTNGVAIDDVELRNFGANPIDLKSGVGAGPFGAVTEGNTLVGNVNVSGSNPGGLTYVVSPLYDGANFTVDNDGNLSFAAGPDFENPTDTGADNTYKVTVLAVDAYGNAAAETYNISVANAALSSPTDTNGASGGSVKEGAANGTTVGITGHASDGAGSPTYSLLDDAGGRFAINATTGVVTVLNGSLLDFETATSHQITIQASDGTDVTQQNFIIQVTDVQGAHLHGSGGNDVIDGTHSPPNVPSSGSPFATTENDVISGGKGNDRIDALAGDDRVYGNQGNDVLRGNTGADRMFGGAGNDRLFGGDGNDTVKGSTGSDRLFGHGGDDDLYGGQGRDFFYFSTGYDNDTVHDYTAGSDVFMLDGTGVANFTELATMMTNQSGSVVIDFGGGDTLTILHTTKAQLMNHSTDFHF